MSTKGERHVSPIGLVPCEWPLRRIDTVAEVAYGISEPINRALASGIPILSLPNVSAACALSFEDVPLIDPALVRDRDMLQRGDVLFNWRNGSTDHLGKVGFFDRDEGYTHVSFLLRVRALGGLHPRFLFYYLELLKQRGFYLTAKIQVNNTFNKEELAEVPIAIPKPEEQQAIVGVLSVWDRGIQRLTKLLNAKLCLKRGLMQQLLTGKRRFPKFAKSQFLERHIGEVLVPVSRLVNWNDEELYRLASIRRHSGGLFWREALLGKDIKVKKLHVLREGDFLISHIQAAYGAMGLVPKEFAGGKVSDMYTILTPANPNTVDMRYIDYLSQMRRMRHQAYLACNGFFAERLRLNFDPAEFLKQKILLPLSIHEQAKIADMLDALVREARLLEQKLDALKQQKKGLMQKLLTGQIRVPTSARKGKKS